MYGIYLLTGSACGEAGRRVRLTVVLVLKVHVPRVTERVEHCEEASLNRLDGDQIGRLRGPRGLLTSDGPQNPWPPAALGAEQSVAKKSVAWQKGCMAARESNSTSAMIEPRISVNERIFLDVEVPRR